MLGLHCTKPLSPLITFGSTASCVGFNIDERAQSTEVYPHLEEFLSYICNSEFDNPCLAFLSDLHPQHEMYLDISLGQKEGSGGDG